MGLVLTGAALSAIAGTMSGTRDIAGDSAGGPPFRLDIAARPGIPVLIAVPHAGRAYRPELLDAMRDPGFTGLRLEDRLADLVGRRVAAQTGAVLLVAHTPRAEIDLNRAPEDMDWTMVADPPAGALAPGKRARSGLGLVPRRLVRVGELWRGPLPRAEIERRLARIHGPYHAALSGALDTIANEWGSALLLDLHSMPPLPRAQPEREPPVYVLGDRFGASCDAVLAAAAIGHFERLGRETAHNRPYAGGYVLERHAAPRRARHAIQLEICRSAYLDADLVEPGQGLGRVVREISGLVRTLAAELAERGSARRLAAE